MSQKDYDYYPLGPTNNQAGNDGELRGYALSVIIKRVCWFLGLSCQLPVVLYDD